MDDPTMPLIEVKGSPAAGGMRYSVRYWGRLCCKSLFAPTNKIEQSFEGLRNCDELTSDLGNGLEATSTGDRSLIALFAGNWSPAFWESCNMG
jgi:hypothetical protein